MEEEFEKHLQKNNHEIDNFADEFKIWREEQTANHKLEAAEIEWEKIKNVKEIINVWRKTIQFVEKIKTEGGTFEEFEQLCYDLNEEINNLEAEIMADKIATDKKSAYNLFARLRNELLNAKYDIKNQSKKAVNM